MHPQPLSRRMKETPPFLISTVIAGAGIYGIFRQFPNAEAGRSTTSPAAIRLAV